MLENAIYSVISPEGCATILWRDPKKTLEAATAMKLTSKELFDLNIVDEIIDEPIGGAHRDREKTLENIRASIEKQLNHFENLNEEEILLQRKNKFLTIGRGNGFSSKSDNTTSLSVEQKNINNLLKKVLKDKKFSLGIIITIFAIMGLIYLL